MKKQTTQRTPTRTVAIVGRPNVGKSSIFNRLASRRIAIVHQDSGVTRDRLVCEVTWENRRFELIDTGGITCQDGSRGQTAIEARINSQVEVAIGEAAAVIFVVDARAGLAALDEEVARLLRASGRPVFIAANKCDPPAGKEAPVEFLKFGWPAFPVSAQHGIGFDALMDAVLPVLPEVEDPSHGAPLKVAVVGRPNVGKSSYINKLLGDDRVMVADQPGTTRDVVDVPFSIGEGPEARHYVLMDTAGLRKPSKSASAADRLSQFRAGEGVARADVVVLLVDASVGPTADDKRVGGLIMEKKKGCVVLVSKWDLAGMSEREFREELSRGLPFMRHCPVVIASVKTGRGIRESVSVIDHVAAQTRLTLTTGLLSRALLDAWRRVKPRAVAGKRLHVFYSVQVGVAPITVRVFVNDPKLVDDSYRSYLVKALRGKFGLEGAPVLLQFRPRR